MARQPTTRLSPRRIETLKPSDKPYRVTDGSATPGGLLLEVRPTGGKSWISRVSIGGGHEKSDSGELIKRRARRVDITLGQWPAIDIETAHALHRKNAAIVASGCDPRAEKQARLIVPLFSELMERWLDHIERNKSLTPRTLEAHRRRWRLHLNRLNTFSVDQLTRAVIAPVLTRIAEKAPAQARASLITLKAALAWACHQGWIDDNPADGMKAGAYGAGTSKPRDVVLTLEELRTVWQAVTASRMDPWTKAAIQLLVLTGARRDEVAGMRIEELDLDNAAWHLPAARAKTSTARTIYLPSMAVSLIRERIKQRTSGPVLSGRTGDGIHADSLTTAMTRLRRGKLNELGQRKPFTIHDLRRSAATAWGECLDAQPELIDRMLGHARRNPIEAAYQHQTYERQQRRIIEAWGALVLDHVANQPGDNVTPMRRKSGHEVAL
ncbi:tyrosine-type recombinase/integrase [Vreelandella massiliensis]|uniref:tyrosine-type recombinase/integrase n=1 Tax=Vreelandella massiliensis TaxID=1816686 RepID=UPI00096A4638|nr:site-specific integrase [Halomonas massiliensis]